MKKNYLILVLSLYFLQSFAQQNNFYVTERFLEGEKVKLFSQNRGSAVVVLEDNTIYLMDKDLQFMDISDQFQSHIREDISSIESINESIFLVGTRENSLLMYREGQVSRLKNANNDLPDRINSIDFASRSYGSKILLATNDSLWISNDFQTYSRSDVKLGANPKFYGGRDVMLVDTKDHYGCYDVTSEHSILYTYNANSSLIFKIFQDEGFDIDKLYDIDFANYYSDNPYTTYGVYAYYATHNGIYAQSIFDCNLDTVVRVSDVEVHDLEFVQNAGLNRNAMLAASDTGLFYNEVDEYGRLNVYQDSIYYTVEGIDSAYSVQYSIFHNTIWVGTNNGLLQVHDDNLVPNSLEPETIELDTVYFCQDRGAFLQVNIHPQLDKQWFKNGEEIQGAISAEYLATEEGLYSIQYEYEDSIYYYDKAYIQLENEFNETIVDQDYIICPDDYSVWLRINDKNYPSHDYSWYSVERGLEFETANSTSSYFYAQEAGNYYFVANNCNGFTYHSDTVLVEKSSLGDEYFSFNSNEGFCEGDTVFIENGDDGVDFQWGVDYADIEGYNESFLVVKREYSTDHVYVRMTDALGCSQDLYARFGAIDPLPSLSEGQEEIYICEEEDFVYLELENGLTLEWAGYSQGEFHKVSAGIYPVTVSNGLCDDYEGEVEIKYYDPFPLLNFEDTVIQVDDTFKIPTNGNSGINWEGEIQMSNDRSYLYLTSDVEESLQAELWISSTDCEQRYSFTVVFEGPSILGVDSQEMSFNIYPNPAKKGVRIDYAQAGIDCVQLLDLNGQLVDTHYFQNQSNVFVDFPDNLKEGAYLLRITDMENQVVTRKILIE